MPSRREILLDLAYDVKVPVVITIDTIHDVAAFPPIYKMHILDPLGTITVVHIQLHT